MSNGKFTLGVVGAQNTGKTTFIKDLIEYTKNSRIYLPFTSVGCDYRKKIEEAGLQINQNGNIRCQNIILDTLIEQLDIIKGMGDGNYVTDRSPIDNFVYSTWLSEHRPESAITSIDLAEIYKKMKDSIKEYDAIVFLDVDNCRDIEIVDDHFRDTDPKFRAEVDKIFKDTFVRLGSECLGDKLNCLIKGTREQRVEQFLNWYDKYIIKSEEAYK